MARVKKITYNGLGFPILLEGVKTREFRGEVLPVINHRKLEDQVFKTLLWLPAHFSGAYLSFVRGYMGLSQKEFATALGLKTHATISGWESKENKATGMPAATEVVIRLLMAEFSGEDFAEHFREFLEVSSPPKNLELKVA
jgi:DNA-binding transcriptional regulator YiaG